MHEINNGESLERFRTRGPEKYRCRRVGKDTTGAVMHDDRLRRTFHDQPISRLAFPQFRFLAAVSRQVSGQQHVQQQSGDTDKKGTFPC